MAKLVFMSNGSIVEQYPLDKAFISIGRRSANDIHVDNVTVSGRHATLSIKDSEYQLEDLASTNGTVVNHVRIKKRVLKDGDLIEFGNYQLTFINENASASSATQNSDIKQDANTQAAYLQVLDGSATGRQLPLNKATVTLGKVGVQVAVVSRHGEAWQIVHAEGQDYPKVNDNLLGAQPYLLADDDVIELAGVKMRFHQARM